MEQLKQNVEIYIASPVLAFVLTEDSTIAVTGLGKRWQQATLIKYEHRNYARQLDEARDMIRQGKFKTITDVMDFCKCRVGNHQYQIAGLMTCPTRLGWHVGDIQIGVPR